METLAKYKHKFTVYKRDKEEYKKLAARAKRKHKNLNDKYEVDMTDEINVPTLKEFDSRAEYNKWKRQIEHFTDRKNYQFRKNQWGVVMPMEDIKEARRANKKAIKTAEDRIKAIKKAKLPYYEAPGKQAGTVTDRLVKYYRESDVHKITVPKKFDFDNISHPDQMKDYIEFQKKKGTEEHFNEKNEQMRKNFIKALENTFDSMADEAVAILKGMSGDAYYQMVLQFDVFDFNVYYHKETQTYGNIRDLKKIEKYLKLYKKGKVDMDFKGF